MNFKILFLFALLLGGALAATSESNAEPESESQPESESESETETESQPESEPESDSDSDIITESETDPDSTETDAETEVIPLPTLHLENIDQIYDISEIVSLLEFYLNLEIFQSLVPELVEPKLENEKHLISNGKYAVVYHNTPQTYENAQFLCSTANSNLFGPFEKTQAFELGNSKNHSEFWIDITSIHKLPKGFRYVFNEIVPQMFEATKVDFEIQSTQGICPFMKIEMDNTNLNPFKKVTVKSANCGVKKNFTCISDEQAFMNARLLFEFQNTIKTELENEFINLIETSSYIKEYFNYTIASLPKISCQNNDLVTVLPSILEEAENPSFVSAKAFVNNAKKVIDLVSEIVKEAAIKFNLKDRVGKTEEGKLCFKHKALTFDTNINNTTNFTIIPPNTIDPSSSFYDFSLVDLILAGTTFLITLIAFVNWYRSFKNQTEINNDIEMQNREVRSILKSPLMRLKRSVSFDCSPSAPNNPYYAEPTSQKTPRRCLRRNSSSESSDSEEVRFLYNR